MAKVDLAGKLEGACVRVDAETYIEDRRLEGLSEGRLRESVTTKTADKRTSGLPSFRTPIAVAFRSSGGTDSGLALGADARDGGDANPRASDVGRTSVSPPRRRGGALALIAATLYTTRFACSQFPPPAPHQRGGDNGHRR